MTLFDRMPKVQKGTLITDKHKSISKMERIHKSELFDDNRGRKSTMYKAWMEIYS